MAKFKPYSYAQTKLIPIHYASQIQSGTFEFAINHIVDQMDLSIFESRFKNDDDGAPAYDPAILLKIVLFAYSRSIISSRQIARACLENVIFMALSADTHPHFTTIADFISSMSDEITPLFRNILMICSKEGLIGKNMFAVDGCKISSNCSKEWSGTRADFEKKKVKLEKAIDFLLRKHRVMDNRNDDKSEDKDGSCGGMRLKEEKAIERLKAKVKKIEGWLSENEDKKGKRGNIKKSNITDNESAKMVSSHGVIQGYNGIAVSDSKHQVIVQAEAFGEGHEGELLSPMIGGIRDNFSGVGEEEDVFKSTTLLADSGYSSEENIKMVLEEEIDAIIADNRYRQRDPAFETAVRHKNPVDKRKTKKANKYFRPKDFHYDEQKKKLICPAGKELYVKNRNFSTTKGQTGIAYEGRKRDCRVCEIREKCLRNPKTEHRQVVIFDGRNSDRQKTWTAQMIERFDSARGRFLYSRRMGIIEPVFANICHQLGMNRFTLRGKTKVDIQWKLYCMVHNIGKIYRYGMVET